jgi:hypothetical protein
MPWLEVNSNPKNDLKPDFFLFPVQLQEFLRDGTPSAKFPTNAFYGSPKPNCALLVDIVLEGKVGTGEISFTDLGKLFYYLSTMCENGSQHPRGIVYNGSGFIFAEYNYGTLHDIIKCRWNVPGSLDLLRSKIRPLDWNPMINILLALKEQSWNFGEVLGRGRFGLVCRAVDNNSHTYALKIVGSNPADVSKEFERVTSCHGKCPNIVVAPTPNSFGIIGDGSYYTMDEVGSSEDLPARGIFLLLWQLHSENIIHGDPRITNVIRLSDGRLKWIDFRYPPLSVWSDLKMLIESWSSQALKNQKILDLMNVYESEVSEDNMRQVYEAVKDTIAIK